MKELNKKDQEVLIRYAKFFHNYNPEYRMAPGMAMQFQMLRKEVEVVLERLATPEF